MSSRMRAGLIVGICVVVLAVAVFVGRSRGGNPQSDMDQYRPSPEALRKMQPSQTNLPPPPGGFTPYGQPPKPGEIRPPPDQSGSYE